VALGLLTLVSPRDALAWNRAGHMVSGAIAYYELRASDPAALQRVLRMLAVHPEYQTRWLPLIRRQGMADHDVMLFMYAARWADDVRGEARYDHPNWHYTNVPFVPPGDSTRPPSVTEGDIIIESYHQFSVMRDPEGPEVQKAEALVWLFHLVGDVHQPLHATNLYSSRWPQGDRGGNLFYIRATPTSQPINLHSFWDGLIIGSDDVRATMNRALALRAAHPRAAVASQIGPLEPRSWAVDESVPLSRRWAYLDGTLAGGTSRETAAVLPSSYAADAQRVAEERVTLAGYRLAAVAARLVADTRSESGSVPTASNGAAGTGSFTAASGQWPSSVATRTRAHSTSSIDRGQSFPSNRDRARSARSRPPV
jgi:hypothetical protein